MPIDYSLELRGAVVAHLRNDPTVTTLIPRGNIFGVRVPANHPKPFSRIEYPDGDAFEATGGWDGSEHRNFRVHVFADGPDEEICFLICRAMQQSIALVAFADENLSLIENEFRRQQVFPDGDDFNGWHGMIDFDMTVTHT